MALREIRLEGDPVLYKVSRPLTKMTERMQTLIDDMFETMYDGEGIGLAAPQVGILRRIFVIDAAQQYEETDPMVFINPEILETKGSQRGSEGCLSVPGKIANVTRPDFVKVKALDRNMEEFVMEADGVLARVILHENDHLDGHLYPEIADGPLMDVEEVLASEESLEEDDTAVDETEVSYHKKIFRNGVECDH